MNIDECISILVEHNAWRRGERPFDEPETSYMVSPKMLGEAIDFAIEHLHILKSLEK